MDAAAVRIQDLVIEAGALVDWLETGRGDLEIVGAALLYVRDQLCATAGQTTDAEACDAACEMVDAIDRLLADPPMRREHRAA
jgi:hypothetical protein